MPIDFSNAWKSGVKIINASVSLLPNLILAAVIFVFFFDSRLGQQIVNTPLRIETPRSPRSDPSD